MIALQSDRSGAVREPDEPSIGFSDQTPSLAPSTASSSWWRVSPVVLGLLAFGDVRGMIRRCFHPAGLVAFGAHRANRSRADAAVRRRRDIRCLAAPGGKCSNWGPTTFPSLGMDSRLEVARLGQHVGVEASRSRGAIENHGGAVLDIERPDAELGAFDASSRRRRTSSRSSLGLLAVVASIDDALDRLDLAFFVARAARCCGPTHLAVGTDDPISLATGPSGSRPRDRTRVGRDPRRTRCLNASLLPRKFSSRPTISFARRIPGVCRYEGCRTRPSCAPATASSSWWRICSSASPPAWAASSERSRMSRKRCAAFQVDLEHSELEGE